MTAPRLHSMNLSARVVTTWVLVWAHFISVVGVPVLPERVRKDHSRVYPCMDRPCGCFDYDECWEGDCCCFTLEQKLAWAAANNVTPPECAMRAAKESSRANCCEKEAAASNCSHCEKQPASCCDKPVSQPAASTGSTKWVHGLSWLKCKGHALTQFHLIANGFTTPVPFVCRQFRIAGERVALDDSVPDSRYAPPDSPPPRL